MWIKDESNYNKKNNMSHAFLWLTYTCALELWWSYVGIEFFFFVSRGGVKDRVFMCKFRNAQITRGCSFIILGEQKLAFNHYIYTSNVSKFGYKISGFFLPTQQGDIQSRTLSAHTSRERF